MREDKYKWVTTGAGEGSLVLLQGGDTERKHKVRDGTCGTRSHQNLQGRFLGNVFAFTRQRSKGGLKRDPGLKTTVHHHLSTLREALLTLEGTEFPQGPVHTGHVAVSEIPALPPHEAVSSLAAWGLGELETCLPAEKTSRCVDDPTGPKEVVLTQIHPKWH